MSTERESIEAVLSPMRDAMQDERYQLVTIAQHLGNARLFLHHLTSNHLSLDNVRPSDVTAYLTEQQQQYQRKHGRPPRSAQTGATCTCVRSNDATLPSQRLAASRTADRTSAWVRTLREEYERWLCDMRGLAPASIRTMSFAAARFMVWWAQHWGAADFDQLSLADIDDYQKFRSGALSRVSCKILAGELRAFLGLSTRHRAPGPQPGAGCYVVQPTTRTKASLRRCPRRTLCACWRRPQRIAVRSAGAITPWCCCSRPMACAPAKCGVCGSRILTGDATFCGSFAARAANDRAYPWFRPWVTQSWPT